MKKIFLLICLAAAMLISRAQSYTISWHKIADGGGAGAGGNFALRGTIGQHDASATGSGGNYSLTGGFWSLTQVVQTTGAPTLYISSAGGVVTIFWQNVTGWSLQQNSDLTAPGGWSVSNGYALVNGTNFLSITNPPEILFYRLIHP